MATFKFPYKSVPSSVSTGVMNSAWSRARIMMAVLASIAMLVIQEVAIREGRSARDGEIVWVREGVCVCVWCVSKREREESETETETQRDRETERQRENRQRDRDRERESTHTPTRTIPGGDECIYDDPAAKRLQEEKRARAVEFKAWKEANNKEAK